MPVRYILINTNPDREHKIYNNLSKDSRILELRPLFREYDMIAKVKIKNHEKFRYFITDYLRSIDGVIDTKTIQ